MSRALRDRRGVSAVAFAITFAVLAPMSLGLFDVYQANEQHGKLQDALDAATLYAARSSATDNPTINSIGSKALAANLQLVPGATLTSSSFTLVNNNTQVQAQAAVQLSAFSPMAGHSPVQVSSEVTRNGNNIEVAMVLDNTGSMAGSPLSSLQSAANQLIDLVVSNTQTPFYSKIAVVPYSNAVNVGAYAATVRGVPITAPSPIAAPCIDLPGCTKMKFTTASGSPPTFNVSSCVSERTGAQAFTDASYNGAPVGWVYPAADNPCIGATIQPLSSNKTTLHNMIGTLTAGGSTAGHIGVAWGWYMLSPNWGGLFPSGSQGAAYGTPNTLKVVILMTDGAFNTAYCKGAISNPSSATDGSSGGSNEHAACASPNGDSFTQAQSLCSAMKAAPNNVIIYTVGFLHGGADPQAQAILANCATDAAHAYLPTTGAALQVAFQAIAADLNKLRISH
ncbi:MAG TPA: pilus assembly protein [Phenylobacterium sp.]|uniref:pilus assembly protein n=1 Tax=Phenylobacterium sp. TaxID=1871053 RepID=UPI002CDCBBFC|nr:pilus assembly protein [Phenylobacterium sp.]HXA38290.1 pilus assembly protein [Phenylobacterium sp.]